MKTLYPLYVSTILALAAVSFPAAAGQAVFSNTRVHSESGNAAKPAGYAYENPIRPGFYPDPSIERVGDDYYLINSSFAFYPGIPIFHSKNLVNWKQIGNAIDRPGMLDFSGLNTSRGVFAPDLSYHDGTFYILNTCVDCKGNFVITAKDPKGPWSDPVWLPFNGIDPSLLWDDDGKAYIAYNDGPEGQPLYEGHRAIWLQQFDPVTKTLVGERKVVVNGGVDLSKKPIWIEGPHIYKLGGHYYLMAAEGGTSEGHSEVIFRAESVWGPYVPYNDNPILTQRDLDPKRPNPVTSSGHADLVQTKDGQWQAVFLATRPYEGDLYNTGRETFLLPVKWKDGWPIILPHGESIPLQVKASPVSGVAPANPAPKTDAVAYDPLQWLQIRSPKTPFLTTGKSNTVTLTALNEPIGDTASHPAFTGLRQTQPHVKFSTTVAYKPASEGDRAGIAAVQNDNFYLFVGIAKRNGKNVIELTRRAGKSEPRDGAVLASAPAPAGPVVLSLTIDGGKAKISYGKTVLADKVDVTSLSTAKAGGFVGTIIGFYAYGQKP